MNHSFIIPPSSAPKGKRSSIITGLSRWPILRHFVSPVTKEPVTETSAAASPPEADVPHISPYFLKGMELGDLMFAIAAVYAHAKRHRLACRIPWAHSRITRSLRRELHNICIPATSGQVNEPVAYSELSRMQYSPIPDDITEGSIKGYFHSPLYFADKETEIRRLYSSLVATEKIPGSVGIHINPGEDTFPYSKFRLATCYYLLRAAAYIPEDAHELTIFSEKPAQALALLTGIPEFSRFSFKPEHLNTFEQLRRMTAMQFLITSTDTLSWWAAWLGKPSQVIVPNYWFSLNGDSLPVIPGSDWMKC
ncbi:MAG: hypothetical protein IJ498_07485 [Akkermansia sp.]|nr:hypothetical protein [Akkermansia sp.]